MYIFLALPLLAPVAAWVVGVVGSPVTLTLITGLGIYGTLINPQAGVQVLTAITTKANGLPRWKEIEDETVTPRKKLQPMRRALEPMVREVDKDQGSPQPLPPLQPKKGTKKKTTPSPKTNTNTKTRPRTAADATTNTNPQSEVEAIRRRMNNKNKVTKKAGLVIPFPDPDDDPTNSSNPNQNPNPNPTPPPNPDPDPIKTDELTDLKDNPKPDINPNQNPTPTVRSKWIVVNQPSHETPVGQVYTPPVINTNIDLSSAPVTDGDTTVFDPSEVFQAVMNATTAEDYADYLFRSSQGLVTGTYEENLDLTDVAIALFPTLFLNGAQIEPVIGLKSLYRIAEAFHNYSDAALSKPIFNVPLEWGIDIIDGINEGQEQQINPYIPEFIKPEDPEFPEKMKEGLLLDNGLVTESDPEKLMTWLGNISVFEGGEAEQEKAEEYQTIDEFLESDYLKNPDINAILNEEPTDEKKLREKDKPAKIKAKSKLDMLQLMMGTIFIKLGLDQFPAKAPSLVDPPVTIDAEDKRTATKPRNEIELQSLAAGLAYGIAGIGKKIGTFPLEIESDSVEDEPDPNNPNATQKKKSHAYMPDMGHAMANLTALSMATAAMSQMNMDMGLKNTRTLTETRSAAIKSMNCSCAMLDFGGGNNNPQQRCTNTQFNMRNAKGFNDMFKPQADQCDVGVQNTDQTTLKKMLTEILWGVNIIKGAFFKGNNELDNQIKSIKEINKEIKDKDKKFDDFVENFNKEKDPLTKPDQYPVKPKIIVEQKSTTNPPTPPTT